MTATLEQLRAEHRSHFIGPELMALLGRIASATARTYPTSYSDAGVWNEDAVADVLQGWVAERLFGRRDLTNLLAGARSVASLRAGLTRSLQQYLTNNRERDSATNLYTRTVKLLKDDPDFSRVGSAPKAHEQLWALADQSLSGPSSASLKQRLEAAAVLSDDDLDVVRYGPFSLKSSPVLREPALKRFVSHLLASLGALTPADIMEIMRRRFALVEPAQLELTEDIVAASPDPYDLATQRVIARSIVSRTNEADAQLLSALGSTADIREAAKLAGCSASDMQHALDRMLEKVALEASDDGDARQISGLVLESLFNTDR